jgi:hypothetical protein
MCINVCFDVVCIWMFVEISLFMFMCEHVCMGKVTFVCEYMYVCVCLHICMLACVSAGLFV